MWKTEGEEGNRLGLGTAVWVVVGGTNYWPWIAICCGDQWLAFGFWLYFLLLLKNIYWGICCPTFNYAWDDWAESMRWGGGGEWILYQIFENWNCDRRFFECGGVKRTNEQIVDDLVEIALIIKLLSVCLAWRSFQSVLFFLAGIAIIFIIHSNW